MHLSHAHSNAHCALHSLLVRPRWERVFISFISVVCFFIYIYFAFKRSRAHTFYSFRRLFRSAPIACRVLYPIRIAFHLLSFWMGNQMPFFITLLHQSASAAHMSEWSQCNFQSGLQCKPTQCPFLLCRSFSDCKIRWEIKTDFVCVCIILCGLFF